MNVDTFKDLLLEMAQQRAVEGLLDHVTQRIGDESDTALFRIWLLREGDRCGECNKEEACRSRPRCLHLATSAGKSLVDGTSWKGIGGSFRRFPVGSRKVGRIAASGEPMEVVPIDPDADWVADPEWIRREKIVSFGGQPLVFRGEVLGVLALFSRSRFVESTLKWLRMVADHLAAALVNARSFEEIESLRRRVEIENDYLRREVDEQRASDGLVSEGPAMKAILRKIAQVAPTDANILLTGESGTGKEVVAREIHARSRRSAQAMVKVNCAAVPRDLFESEFFGHAKGAFTGADRDRVGLFQVADRGTLFLDEVGEIPLELQGKLLRVLQEREFRRVGEGQERSVDVRVIAASNRDLPAEVEAGRFRQDLYYRLQVFPFEIPPLRERPEDIGALAAHFLRLSQKGLKRRGLALTPADIELLQAYHWPGNCRELQNVIERAAITAQGDELNLEVPGGAPRQRTGTAVRIAAASASSLRILTEDEVREFERDNTLRALERSSWRIYGTGSASEALHLPPTTLLSRIKRMGLSRRGAEPSGN
ncbi:MAG: sigma 54-interacting transcriptional regulator [Deltaproteobacteria bacterium]